MNDPLVSVVIPTYNCGDYVEEAVNSALNQTYQNLEIIVINDGSTDDTVSRLEKYKNEKRVRIVSQANRGLSGARNAGIELSTGEYVALLDSDDRWLPNKLERQMACFQELEGVEMVFSDFSAIDAYGVTVSDNHDAFQMLREYNLSLPDLFKESRKLTTPAAAGLRVCFGSVFVEMCKGNFILPSTTIYRRSSIENPARRFNESYRVAEETDFHLRFSLRHKIAWLDAVTTEYRIGRKGKLSGNTNTQRLILNAIETLRDVFEQNPDLKSVHGDLYNKSMGMHHARLAYYYLSVLDKANARKYASESLKYAPFRPKPIAIYAFSFLPVFALKFMGRLKSRRNVTEATQQAGSAAT